MLFVKRSILVGSSAIHCCLWRLSQASFGQMRSVRPRSRNLRMPGALEAAQKAEVGGKYAPSYITQAEDFLKTAGSARSIPDAEDSAGLRVWPGLMPSWLRLLLS